MLHCHLPHHMMNAMSSVVGRMTRGSNGMPAGVGMEEGMGIMRQGPALAEDKGPSLGRGMGVGATLDERTSNGLLSESQSVQPTPGTQREKMPGMQHQMQPEIAPDANSTPGFPQDAFMEGPAMAMDKMVDRPENYGLRPGWSGFMQGMMTFVRVLPPGKYDEVMSKIQQKRPTQKPMPGMEHEHGA